MSSFSDLKRSSANSVEKLNQELNKLNAPQNGARDDRLWSCTTDKSGNGYAVIRFLPAPAGEDVPFVRLFTHGFKGPGGWYIENSRTTIGESDPVAEMNTKLWAEGEGSPGRKFVQGSGKEQPGSKRQLNFYSNIYVINDPANPENNGKVFLFKYGKKIFDKLNDLMNPQFEDEAAVDPFNFWTGANFKLKIRRVDGYANYDKAEFDTPGPLFDDDDKMEAIWKSQYSLAELVSAKNFKSYDDLKKRLDKALGLSGAPTKSPIQQDEDDDLPFEPTPKQKAAAPSSKPLFAEDDDDDDIALFRQAAEED